MKKVLVWLVLLSFILPNCAYAQENTIVCQPGDVFEAVFALTTDSVVPSAVMGELEYDHDVFEMLPSSSTVYADGRIGVFIYNGNPAPVSFRVSKYAPNGTYTLNVRVLDTTATDRNESDRVKIEPVQVMIGPEQPANPASDFEYKIENNQVTITKYIGESTEVRIPVKIEGYPVANIGDRVFFGRSNITNITIPSSVISIGKSAFYACSNLTDITIPSSVTSIGGYAFSDCRNISSVTIPSSVTSIEREAFKNCSNLITISLPSSVTSIGESAFSGCSSLTSITIPSSVTRIEKSAFSRCSNLADITIPSSVTMIGKYAFSGCSSLASITIPSRVTSVGIGTFSDCSNLTSITLSSGVLSIESKAFLRCIELTNITIPSSVTSIGESAFRECHSLTSITIPSSVTSIGSYAFIYCDKLMVTVPRDSYAESYCKQRGLKYQYASNLTIRVRNNSMEMNGDTE